MLTKIILVGMLLQPIRIKQPLPGSKLRDSSKNYIVLHNDGSNHGAAATRLALRFRGLSYHYFINRSGRLYEFKNIKHKASHAGVSKYLGLSNWNDFSIGICLQGTDNSNYTTEQYATLNKLIAYIHKRYPDSKKRPIVTHSQIAWPRGRKHDPGENFDFDKLDSGRKRL